MAGTDIAIRTEAGIFAGMAWGAAGPDCLLIHGTGQNALAWRAFAEILGRTCRVVAFDMRGHGRTAENSTDAEQYWRDIEPVLAALEMTRPILVGHSSGAYAAMAHAASGGRAAAIVCVDGFTLDACAPARAAAGPRDGAEMSLFGTFRYGWVATRSARDAFIARILAEAPRDAFNAGIEPSLLQDMLRRCFVARDGRFLRRPTMAEIRVVSSPPEDAAVGPCRRIYDQLGVPLLLVWARHGLSAHRFAEVEALAAAGPERMLAVIAAGHNVPMQRPGELASLILSRLPALAVPAHLQQI